MVSLSGNSGPMSTPPRPARSIVITHATADERAVLTPAQGRERLAVDAGAHLQTGARLADDEPQEERGDGGGHEHRELIAVEVDVRQAGPAEPEHVRRRRPHPRHRSTGRRELADQGQVGTEQPVPDRLDQPLRQRRQRDQQADGADDAGVDRRLGQAAQQDPVEQQARASGREDEDRDDQRGHDRHVLADVQLVVEVRAGERDRAVGEVEDPRRLVRQHDPRRHDRVDRAGHEAGEDEVQELVQRAPAPCFGRQEGVASAEPEGSMPSGSVRCSRWDPWIPASLRLRRRDHLLGLGAAGRAEDERRVAAVGHDDRERGAVALGELGARRAQRVGGRVGGRADDVPLIWYVIFDAAFWMHCGVGFLPAAFTAWMNMSAENHPASVPRLSAASCLWMEATTFWMLALSVASGVAHCV